MRTKFFSFLVACTLLESCEEGRASAVVEAGEQAMLVQGFWMTARLTLQNNTAEYWDHLRKCTVGGSVENPQTDLEKATKHANDFLAKLRSIPYERPLSLKELVDLSYRFPDDPSVDLTDFNEFIRKLRIAYRDANATLNFYRQHPVSPIFHILDDPIHNIDALMLAIKFFEDDRAISELVKIDFYGYLLAQIHHIPPFPGRESWWTYMCSGIKKKMMLIAHCLEPVLSICDMTGNDPHIGPLLSQRDVRAQYFQHQDRTNRMAHLYFSHWMCNPKYEAGESIRFLIEFLQSHPLEEESFGSIFQFLRLYNALMGFQPKVPLKNFTQEQYDVLRPYGERLESVLQEKTRQFLVYLDRQMSLEDIEIASGTKNFLDPINQTLKKKTLTKKHLLDIYETLREEIQSERHCDILTLQAIKVILTMFQNQPVWFQSKPYLIEETELYLNQAKKIINFYVEDLDMYSLKLNNLDALKRYWGRLHNMEKFFNEIELMAQGLLSRQGEVESDRQVRLAERAAEEIARQVHISQVIQARQVKKVVPEITPEQQALADQTAVALEMEEQARLKALAEKAEKRAKKRADKKRAQEEEALQSLKAKQKEQEAREIALRAKRDIEAKAFFEALERGTTRLDTYEFPAAVTLRAEMSIPAKHSARKKKRGHKEKKGAVHLSGKGVAVAGSSAAGDVVIAETMMGSHPQDQPALPEGVIPTDLEQHLTEVISKEGIAALSQDPTPTSVSLSEERATSVAYLSQPTLMAAEQVFFESPALPGLHQAYMHRNLDAMLWMLEQLFGYDASLSLYRGDHRYVHRPAILQWIDRIYRGGFDLTYHEHRIKGLYFGVYQSVYQISDPWVRFVTLCGLVRSHLPDDQTIDWLHGNVVLSFNDLKDRGVDLKVLSEFVKAIGK